MNREHRIMDLGGQFGNEAVEHIARRAEAYCDCEREHIELANQPQINALQLEGHYLTNCERELRVRLERTAPPADLPRRRRRARYYWVTCLILAVSAFFLSLIALAPFRLGWPGILFCMGIGIVTPFAVEEFLEAWKSDNLFKMMVTVVFCTAVMGGGFLAVIRGDLMAQQVDQASQPVIITNGQALSTPEPQNTFYEKTGTSLRLFMVLLALAIDLGAGVAAHRALVFGATSGEEYLVIFKELQEVHQRLRDLVFEITALKNAPGIFVTRFWRDFYRAMLTQTARKALTKFLVLPLCLFLAMSFQADAQQRLNIVAGLDLSTSEAAKGPDHKVALNRNIDGVAHLLASLPAGAQLTVIGITANSFSQPYVLLSAKLTDDPGYFGERLAAARNQLVRTWQERAAALTPNATGTDILGCLFTASEIFRSGPAGARDVIVLFSDMRHVAREVDLETPRMLRVDAIIAAVRARGLIADLSGVIAYVLGANAQEKQSIAQWNALKEFWAAYFMRAGAHLAGYSIGSEPPSLEP